MIRTRYFPRCSVSSAAHAAAAVGGAVNAVCFTVIWQIFLFIDWTTADVNGDSTCSYEQVTQCRKAASNGQLGQLSAGGKCLAKPYVHFTHLCTVDNYVPGAVDHCCCQVTNPDRLLCCRYNQDWYHFRCRESTDDISLSYGNERFMSVVNSATHVVISAVVIVLIAALVTVIMCMRHRRIKNRRTDRRSAAATLCSCCYISACDVTPSTRRPSFRNCDVMSGHDKGPFQIFQTTPLQPSAPPLQGGVSCVDATRANDTSGQVDCQHCLRASVACDVCRRSASGRAYDYPVDDCDVTSSIMRSYNGIFNWSDGCDWSDHSHLPFCRLMPPPPPYTD